LNFSVGRLFSFGLPRYARGMQSPEARLKTFYELRAGEEPESDPEATLRFRKALDAAHLLPGQRLLDVGAKWGGLGLYARSLDFDIGYTGLDLSEENVRKAAELGLDVRLADASQRLPVDDHTYDCIVCLELLEHLPRPVALFGEFGRVLKPEGRAIVSVPNPYSWVEVYREVFRRSDPEGHLNAFTTPVMENLLALAGLRLERRLGTSLRIPKTSRLLSTNSILARSRIYVARPAERVVFAGREL
jgi:2-polyprenyl-3-methyl-5-hydroxy-6-metoxy-1,4-benzoquinol methylase